MRSPVPADRADHEIAVRAIAPCKEGDLIAVRGLGFATITDIGDGEVGGVLSNGRTILLRIVGRNAAVRG
jgi:hypothetical protein